MIILTVNTGTPKTYTLDGKTAETSMIRTPQPEIDVTFSKVKGDKFKSTSIHGTRDSVVYAYSSDRYTYWSEYLGFEVKNGYFGENLTIDKLREEDFMLGSEYQAGETMLKVTGPRYPCSKLNFVSGNKSLQSHFAEKAWPGVYFQVLQEGKIKPGDKLKLRNQMQDQVSVMDLFLAMRVKKRKENSRQIIEKVLNCDVLLDKYRNQF